MFDAAAMRTALEARQAELQEELRRVRRGWMAAVDGVAVHVCTCLSEEPTQRIR